MLQSAGRREFDDRINDSGFYPQQKAADGIGIISHGTLSGTIYSRGKL